MRGVFKHFRRTTTLLVLLVVFAQTAVAADHFDRRGWRERYERAKRFAVTVLARLSIPPG